MTSGEAVLIGIGILAVCFIIGGILYDIRDDDY